MRLVLLFILSLASCVAKTVVTNIPHLPDPTQPCPFYNSETADGAGNFNTEWKGFPDHWSAREKQFSQTAAQEKNAVVFLGDSITELCQLKQFFPNLPVANRGISGDTSRGMLNRLAYDVLAIQPKAVVLLCGTNDIMQPNFSVKGSTKSIQIIVERIHSTYPKIKIIVPETLPMQVSGDADQIKHVTQQNADFNQSVTNMLANYSCVIRVPTSTPFRNPDQSVNLSLFKDGIHPNRAGYAVYQKLLTPIIQQAIQ